MRIIGQAKNENESTKTKLGWPRPSWVDQDQVELTKTKLGLTMVEESEMEKSVPVDPRLHPRHQEPECILPRDAMT